MVRFECKKCGSLVVAEKDSKSATCSICGLKQRIPMTVIKEMRLTTNNNYDPQRKHYEQLLYKSRKYRDVKILTETAEEFDRLGNYENSREMAEFCRKRIAEEQGRLTEESEKQKTEDQQKDRSRKIYHFRMALLNIGVVVLAIVITMIGNYFLKNSSFHKATSYISSGQYEEGLRILNKLNGYRDSEKWIEKGEAELMEYNYNDAVETLNKGYYVSAFHKFEALNGYKDSATLALECKYQDALRFIKAGNYQTALEELTELGDYKDSKEQIQVCEAALLELEAEMTEARYNNAIETMNKGRYADAQHMFDQLNGYRDSDALALECRYQKALQLMSEENYERALEEFEVIGDYKDAVQQAEIARSKLT